MAERANPATKGRALSNASRAAGSRQLTKVPTECKGRTSVEPHYEPEPDNALGALGWLRLRAEKLTRQEARFVRDLYDSAFADQLELSKKQVVELSAIYQRIAAEEEGCA